MPLKIQVRTGQVLLINGARFVASMRSSQLALLTREDRVMFGRMVIDEVATTTPICALYFAMQQAYAGSNGKEQERWKSSVPQRFTDAYATYTSDVYTSVLRDVQCLWKKKKHYRALQELQRLIVRIEGSFPVCRI